MKLNGLKPLDIEVMAMLCEHTGKTPKEIAEELMQNGGLFAQVRLAADSATMQVRGCIRRVQEYLEHEGYIDPIVRVHDYEGKVGEKLHYSFSQSAARRVRELLA